MLPFTVTRLVTIEEMSIAPNAHDAKLDLGRELTDSNLSHDPARLAQNKP